MEQNTFIPIKDFETYAINILGDVKDLRTGKIMRIYSNPDNYKYISLKNKDGYTTHRIHRLLGLHFIPNTDIEKNEIDHINRIRDDNRIDNLRWVSRSENQINKLYTNTKYKKHIRLEDLKSKKCPNPSWIIHINNQLCKFRKRFQFANYTYEDIIKIRNDVLTQHNILIID